ncbi:hypothetical protein EMIT0158MI4_10624 [Burkholderia ambifaria]
MAEENIGEFACSVPLWDLGTVVYPTRVEAVG